MNGFWRNWLNAVCSVVVLFGLVMAGAALPATEWPARLLLEWQNGGPLAIDRAARIAFGVLGGVMCGWGVTLFAAFQAAERIAGDARGIWRWLLASILFWFAVDSTLSVATGFALNAVMNVGFLVALALPLFATGVLNGRPAK
ncbi:hypothetical protein [Sphingomonas sp.]|uniref:hypothetical protein n=1 Tax=Sphingomonas sp. TaxID=28214 RepID=UPI001E07BE78|nr:hypothetical protein [Sphingomonas sp.]MBX9796246.1 hypothetical protein [Sphingomonas sp.]